MGDNEGKWYYCLKHHRVEMYDGCRSEDRLGPYDDRPQERAAVAVELAIRQVEDLIARGISEFHFYTMNRATMVSAVCDRVGFAKAERRPAGAAA